MKDAPEWTAKDVPNLQAIQAPCSGEPPDAVEGVRLEGVLSGDGIAIDVVTIESYLQRAKAGGVGPARKRRGGTEAKQRTMLRSGNNTGEGNPRRQRKT